MTRNFHRFTMVMVLAALSFASTNTALAKSVTFQREYTYQASEADSKLTCRVIALEQVKRLLLEELGTYLEAETEVKNYQLTKDQITTLTAGVVQTEKVDESWDGEKYWLKAKVTADPGEVAKSIDALRKDRKKTKELEELRKQAEKTSREVERLRQELAVARTKSDKSQPRYEFIKLEQRKYQEKIDELMEIDWFERGYALANSRDYEQAIRAFSMAIDLNQSSARSYFNRAYVYTSNLGKHAEAIRDLNKAIQIDPGLSRAYLVRGAIYSVKLHHYPLALKDFNKFVELDPGYEAFFGRGTTHYHLGNYQEALGDLNAAIALKPELRTSYFYRAATHFELGNNELARMDAEIARTGYRTKDSSPHLIYKWTDKKGVVHLSKSPPWDKSIKFEIIGD